MGQMYHFRVLYNIWAFPCGSVCGTRETPKIFSQMNVIILKHDRNTGEFLEIWAMKNEISIHEAQELVDHWIKTHGVRYFSELSNMTILTEEVGELARIMVRRYGDQSEKESDKNKDLGDEMADILWVLCCLANQTGVDLTQAFKNNLDKKTSRDKDRHKQNPKLI